MNDSGRLVRSVYITSVVFSPGTLSSLRRTGAHYPHPPETILPKKVSSNQSNLHIHTPPTPPYPHPKTYPHPYPYLYPSTSIFRWCPMPLSPRVSASSGTFLLVVFFCLFFSAPLSHLKKLSGHAFLASDHLLLLFCGLEGHKRQKKFFPSGMPLSFPFPMLGESCPPPGKDYLTVFASDF